MIPIGDTTPRRRIPYVTWGIILINVMVWLYQVLMPYSELQRFIYRAAIIPARLTSDPGLPAAMTLLSAMFMHGSWQHIIGNMLYLAIFGDNIEDRFGHVVYLLYYLLGGVAASLAQIAVSPTSRVPIIGASGAIAAVLGTYLVLFPKQRVHSLVIFFGFIRIAVLPAVFVLGMWFVMQLFNGVASIAATASGGVAWFAHIGGFIFGLLAGLAARVIQGSRMPPYYIPR